MDTLTPLPLLCTVLPLLVAALCLQVLAAVVQAWRKNCAEFLALHRLRCTVVPRASEGSGRFGNDQAVLRAPQTDSNMFASSDFVLLTLTLTFVHFKTIQNCCQGSLRPAS